MPAPCGGVGEDGIPGAIVIICGRMSKLIIVILLFLTATFVIFSFSQLQDVVATLQQADAWFVALAVLIEGGWFVMVAWMFRSLYRLLGLAEGTERLTQLFAASCFVGVVAPSAGFGGLAIFIADGRTRGHASGKVTVAGVLYALLDQTVILCLLAVGFLVLIRRGHLDAAEVSAALMLLASAIFIAFLLYLAYRSPAALARVLASLAHFINIIARPFVRRALLSEARAHTYAADISDGLGAVPAKPLSLLRPFLLALASKVLLMGVLICSFLAFDISFSAGTIISGFAITYLFVIVSPTPQGVGVVEGLMALALVGLGVEFSQAVVVTLTYRGITFWLPLAVGALALRSLRLGTDQPTAPQGST
jgi:uncharacterized protein (TIRG00374 family)